MSVGEYIIFDRTTECSKVATPETVAKTNEEVSGCKSKILSINIEILKEA